MRHYGIYTRELQVSEDVAHIACFPVSPRPLSESPPSTSHTIAPSGKTPSSSTATPTGANSNTPNKLSCVLANPKMPAPERKVNGLVAKI